MIKGFVAYPSSNSSLTETINLSIDEINKTGMCNLTSWEDMSVTGQFVINEICKEIDKSNLFVCDLTSLNHNVLFELGYAIAKGKRIWMLLNQDIENTFEDFERLKILTTVGYVKYSNSLDITNAFYREIPYNQECILRPIDILSSSNISLLYLKSAIESEASMKLSRLIDKCEFSKITDDPYECTNNLSWYLQQVIAADHILIHFSSNQHRDYRFHNAKNSFIAGLSYGYDKKLLMLAHYPYSSPIDYREFLKVHNTAYECLSHAKDMLDSIAIENVAEKRKRQAYELTKKAHQKLQNLGIGEHVAENEIEKLDDYFVETSIFQEGLHNEGHIIYIGAKGVGKSATFFQLSKSLTQKNNLVCIIKPPAYQLKGIIEVLTESLKVSQKGYLTDSLWKFLLYSETLIELYKKAKENEKKPNYILNDDEKKLIDYIEKEATFIKQDFSERLEHIVNILKESITKDGKIDLFYTKTFSVAKKLIRNNFGKHQKLIILIDNLDKAWEKDSDLKILSDFLFSLFRVSRAVSLDLIQREYNHSRIPVSTIIFLRKDIFYHMRKLSREPDKISYRKICWDDRRMLLRVINERLIAAFPQKTMTPDDIWEKFFTSSVNGKQTQDFIFDHILPRPRDMIVFIKMCIAKAIDRGHIKVKENDILSALQDYSRVAFEILLIESGNNIKEIEKVAYEFLGLKSVITHSDIDKIIEKGKISLSAEYIVDFLCNASFLGLEIRNNEFVFLHDYENAEKYKVMAQKVSETNDGTKRYKINRTFHSYLEIADEVSV